MSRNALRNYSKSQNILSKHDCHAIVCYSLKKREGISLPHMNVPHMFLKEFALFSEVRTTSKAMGPCWTSTSAYLYVRTACWSLFFTVAKHYSNQLFTQQLCVFKVDFQEKKALPNAVFSWTFQSLNSLQEARASRIWNICITLGSYGNYNDVVTVIWQFSKFFLSPGD